VMAAARKHGLYVILDAHEYMSEAVDEAKAREDQKVKGWDEATIQRWINSWVAVAKRYKDDPYVLGYELLNEPHAILPEQARKNYTRCIRAIREVDQRHILIVGNHNWSHARAMEGTWGPVASTVDAPYNNIVFAFHDYPEDNHPWIVQDHITKFRDTHNVPVMCTEFGATHWNKSETVCREFLAGMHTLFAKEDVGWMIWALKRLEDSPRSPYNEVDKTGLGPPRVYDSCPYSDLWVPAARIMASPIPQPRNAQ
jgi:aryl-phospho-beta-D-glucosidase BglC (GH1 family)